MMRHMRRATTAACLALAASASGAAGQLSIAGGPAAALGNLGDATDMGYHVMLSTGISVPLIPISVRLDGAWNQFPLAAPADGNVRVLSGALNAVFSIPSIGITPYIIGGLGFYNSRASDDVTEDGSSTDIGANAGAGVRIGLPGLAVFGEARLHNIFAPALKCAGCPEGGDTRFVPISLGIRF